MSVWGTYQRKERNKKRQQIYPLDLLGRGRTGHDVRDLQLFVRMRRMQYMRMRRQKLVRMRRQKLVRMRRQKLVRMRRQKLVRMRRQKMVRMRRQIGAHYHYDNDM